MDIVGQKNDIRLMAGFRGGDRGYGRHNNGTFLPVLVHAALQVCRRRRTPLCLSLFQ
jgi:hypothetical protein